MTQGLRELHQHELMDELEKCLVPAIGVQLRARCDGHCMRVSDLDADLAVRLCQRLRSSVPTANVVILTDGKRPDVPAGMAVSSTKLVELRNPRNDGVSDQRLVFIPVGLRPPPKTLSAWPLLKSYDCPTCTRSSANGSPATSLPRFARRWSRAFIGSARISPGRSPVKPLWFAIS